jgi:hypothetical protein
MVDERATSGVREPGEGLALEARRASPAWTRGTVIFGSLVALAMGVTLWVLGSRVNVPAGVFVPGLAGHGPDSLAWRRLLAVWVPVGHALFAGTHAWLMRGRQTVALRRYGALDQLVSLGSVLALATLLGLGIPVSSRIGLSGAFVLFVAVKTAILLRALWVWMATTAPPPRRATAAVFLVALAPYLLLGAHLTTSTSATGDEPYYLLVTHSLLRDGDLDLANNLSRRDYLPFYWGVLEMHASGVIVVPDGRVYATSFQGLQPALLLPGYWLAGRAGAVATVNLAGALALALTFRLALLAGASARASYLAWLGAAFSVPVVSFAASPWPEMTGALLATSSVFLILKSPRTTAAVPAAALALALMVAVKTRLFLLALPILAGTLRRATWRSAAALAASAVAAFAVMASYDAFALGGQVVRRIQTRGFLGMLGWLFGWATGAVTEYRGLLGLLLDQEFGIVLVAPVWALALVGAVVAARERRWRFVLLTAGPFVLAWYILGGVGVSRGAGTGGWTAGFSPPGRFVAAALPLLAVSGALALDRITGRRAWAAVAGAFAATLGHTALLSVWPAWRFQHGIGRATGLAELFRRTGIDGGRLLPSYVAPGVGWTVIGVLFVVAVVGAGWALAGRHGGPPPRWTGLLGTLWVGLAGAAAVLVLWLSPEGRYPAILGEGRGGVSFHGVIPVATEAGAVPRERLVWAAQRPSTLELSPRLPAGTYRVIVSAGAQAGPEAPRLRIRLGEGADSVITMAAAPPPAWREDNYVTEVVWPGGRLPVRLELTGISRANPPRLAYLRAVEVQQRETLGRR